jgi:type IV pilus assembly protein PilC
MADKTLAPAQLELFFSNLELVYHSGLPLTEGFDILRANACDDVERRMMEVLHEAALEGSSLHQALGKFDYLPDYALALIRIGEQTGRMEETFASLRAYYAKRDLLSRSIRSSLTYPLSMLVVVVAIVVVLLTQAMPVFDQVFDQLGYQMTGLAAGLMAFGTMLSQYALWIVVVLVALVIVAAIIRLVPAGKRFYSTLYQSAPVTRDLSLRLSTQRFTIALASLLDAGLEVNQALEYAEPLVEDKRAQSRIERIRQAVEAGAPFITAIGKSELFSPRSMALLAVGFKTGADSDALRQVGDQIALSTENRMDSLVAAIEPTLVAIMCALVGLILLSVMLPLLGVLAGL